MKTSEAMAQSVMDRAQKTIRTRRRITALTLCLACICGIAVAAMTMRPPAPAITLQNSTTPTSHTIPNNQPQEPADAPRLTLCLTSLRTGNTASLAEDVLLPCEMEVRLHDVRGWSEEEIRQLRDAEKARMEEELSEVVTPGMNWYYGIADSKSTVYSYRQTGYFMLTLEDFAVVKSIHVQHGNMSQLNILPNDTSFDPIEEKEQYHQNYHLEGSQLPSRSGKGSIQFAWFPAQKLQYILAHEPTYDLTNIRDNITITVTYTDGTQDIKIIALSADETGDIYATLHGDTMTT